MRPDNLQDRPFFRPEAESYRRQRHLGDIIMFRPLSLRLVTLYPLVVVALFLVAISQLELRLRFVALAEEISAQAGEVSVFLEPSAAESFRPGDSIELRFEGAAERAHGSITRAAVVPCSEQAHAFLLSRSHAAPQRCLRITVTTSAARAVAPATPPVTAELWSSPQSYLAHLLRW